MRTLIAVAEPALRQELQGLLTEWGYQVTVARDGSEAYEMLRTENTPCIVILDWEMPGMNGVEICRKLKEKPPLRSIYLLLLSLRQHDEGPGSAAAAGADDCIFMPLQQNELKARLRAGRLIIELREELATGRAILREKTTPAAESAPEIAEMQRRLAVLDRSAIDSAQLEGEIQDAREYAENIVETVREPLVVLDSELKVLTANQSFYAVFQVRPEDTIGNFIYELGNRQWDIPKLRILLEEILPHDSVFNGYEVEHDFIDVGRKTMLLNARQIFRKDIGSHIILLAMEDITARKQVAEALQISEKKFSDIFHSVPSLLTISTLKEGTFLEVNQTSLETLGYSREEMIGKSARELGLWEDEAQHAMVLATLQEHGGVYNQEVRLKVKGGPILTGLLSAKLIDINGAWRMLSIVRDISDRKSAEEEIGRLNITLADRAAELEIVNKELEAFDYTVAHDLRQPLNLLNSYCQVITTLCGAQLPEECRGYLNDAYNVTLRMNRLIEALLNFSRMGHLEPHRESVDLSLLAREVAGSLQQTSPERQVEFRIADGLAANGDAVLLQVVLDNLLGNAWKYTGVREQAVIEFGVREIDQVPTYFVRDNGAGFDMTDAEKLFFPFQRLPGAETSRGFGIGLATVERIIRQHGGKVWAESELNKGASFYFTLPITPPRPSLPLTPTK
jgi:PAS domain S-box-containing protein